MPPAPGADWIASLDRMSAQVGRSISDLDRYEREWSSQGEAAAAISPEQLFAWLERRLGAWDGKLGEATALAESVENQLVEREGALARWHQLFVRWRDLIQQGGGTGVSAEGARPVE
jgi:hypothetical protein